MAPVESRVYLVPQVHWASKAYRVSQVSQESLEFRFVAFPFSCVVGFGLVLGLDHGWVFLFLFLCFVLFVKYQLFWE